MSYKVSIVNQADIIFPSFDAAFVHLRNRMYMNTPRSAVKELVDAGEIYRTVYGFYYGEMEKVS